MEGHGPSRDPTWCVPARGEDAPRIRDSTQPARFAEKMNTYLLDTSVLIDLLNGKRGRDALLLRLLSEGHLLACCSINVTEVYAGMRPGEQAKTDSFMDSLQYWSFRDFRGSQGSS